MFTLQTQFVEPINCPLQKVNITGIRSIGFGDSKADVRENLSIYSLIVIISFHKCYFYPLLSIHYLLPIHCCKLTHPTNFINCFYRVASPTTKTWLYPLSGWWIFFHWLRKKQLMSLNKLMCMQSTWRVHKNNKELIGKGQFSPLTFTCRFLLHINPCRLCGDKGAVKSVLKPHRWNASCFGERSVKKMFAPEPENFEAALWTNQPKGSRRVNEIDCRTANQLTRSRRKNAELSGFISREELGV